MSKALLKSRIIRLLLDFSDFSKRTVLTLFNPCKITRGSPSYQQSTLSGIKNWHGDILYSELDKGQVLRRSLQLWRLVGSDCNFATPLKIISYKINNKTESILVVLDC